MTTYSAKLKDPRWQKMRLKIMERDNWTCQQCGDDNSTLHVHHKSYAYGCDPWDYPETNLVTLCEDCHEREQDRKTWESDLIQCLRRIGLHADGIAVLADEIERFHRRVDFDTYVIMLHKTDSGAHIKHLPPEVAQCAFETWVDLCAKTNQSPYTPSIPIPTDELKREIVNRIRTSAQKPEGEA